MKITFDQFATDMKREMEVEQQIFRETIFRDIPEWSSMHALILTALCESEYNVTITGQQLRECKTVEDIYNLIISF